MFHNISFFFKKSDSDNDILSIQCSNSLILKPTACVILYQFMTGFYFEGMEEMKENRRMKVVFVFS